MFQQTDTKNYAFVLDENYSAKGYLRDASLLNLFFLAGNKFFKEFLNIFLKFILTNLIKIL